MKCSKEKTKEKSIRIFKMNIKYGMHVFNNMHANCQFIVFASHDQTLSFSQQKGDWMTELYSVHVIAHAISDF